jgi:hypothetical protein
MFCLIILQIILVKLLLYTIACTLDGQAETLALSRAFRLKALLHICRRSKDNSTDYLSIIPPSHNGKQQTLAQVRLRLGVHLTPEWPLLVHTRTMSEFFVRSWRARCRGAVIIPTQSIHFVSAQAQVRDTFLSHGY